MRQGKNPNEVGYRQRKEVQRLSPKRILMSRARTNMTLGEVAVNKAYGNLSKGDNQVKKMCQG